MNRQTKNQLFGTISGLGILIGLYIWYKLSLGTYEFFAVLILPNLIAAIFIKLIPDKKNKKTTSKNTPSVIQRTPRKTNNPHNTMSYEELLVVDLEEMNGFDFENLCYYYLKSIYKECEQTSLSKDRGVDIIYRDREGFRVAVQVKHRTESGNYITVNEINALEGAKRNHKCTRTMFITTTGYTNDALDVATERKMRTEGITWVENKILRWRDKEARKKNLA